MIDKAISKSYEINIATKSEAKDQVHLSKIGNPLDQEMREHGECGARYQVSMQPGI